MILTNSVARVGLTAVSGLLAVIKSKRITIRFVPLILVTLVSSHTLARAQDSEKDKKGKFEVYMLTKGSGSIKSSTFTLLSIDKDGKLRDEKSKIITDEMVRSLLSTKKGESPFDRRVIVQINDMDMPISTLTKQIGLMHDAADPNSNIVIEIHPPPKLRP